MHTPSFLATVGLLFGTLLGVAAAEDGAPPSISTATYGVSELDAAVAGLGGGDLTSNFCAYCGPDAKKDDMNKLRCYYFSAAMCTVYEDMSFCETKAKCSLQTNDGGGNGDNVMMIPNTRLNKCVGAAQDFQGSSDECEGFNSSDDEVDEETYRWQMQNPTKCSKDCGTNGNNSGTYTLEVVCVTGTSPDKKTVDSSYCDSDTKPKTEYKCNVAPCPKKNDKKKHVAVLGPWDDCSKTCKTGEKRRERMCLNAETGEPTNSGNCGKDFKDEVVAACNHQKVCDGYYLQYTPWSDCSKQCSNSKTQVVGMSTRTVKCFKKGSSKEQDLEDCEDDGLEVGPLTQPCNVFAKCSNGKKKKKGFGESLSTSTVSGMVVGIIAVAGVVAAGVAVKRRRLKDAEQRKLMEEEDHETGSTPGQAKTDLKRIAEKARV